MHFTRVKLTGAMCVAAASVALMGSAPRSSSELRVCADPYNMPFSNDREEGFENKIALVVARDLNARVINYWWPSRRGFMRNSILGGFCDVMIEAPVGLDAVATTKRSEEHTSELQSLAYLVCRLLLEKKKKNNNQMHLI